VADEVTSLETPGESPGDNAQDVKPSPATRPPAKAWQILFGLLISGYLLALPGGLLPLWGYHLHPDYGVAGNYFLALGAGIAAGGIFAQRWAKLIALERLLAAGSGLAALALGMIAFAAPPAQVWYQALALLVAGLAAGIVNTAVFEGASISYESNPASITLIGGIFFGAGSVLAAFIMTEALDMALGEQGATRMMLVTALLPAAAALSYLRLRVERNEVTEVTVAQSVRDLSSALAVMFALLLFFQFANEWLFAAWLPVFLIDRMGMSPSSAVSLLAVYWTALTIGRIVAAKLLPFVRHGRMLGLSALFALFGCSLIAFGSSAGVVVGLLLTGGGFSAIYPLAAERIASRFSYYHPGYFNGIFTFALMGGILSPFALGHVAMGSGLSAIPVAAMIGSCAVFALVLLIWLGRKVSGH
jgi:FHS family glucose/mannose:H+ symporter-like MFS transporter